MIKKFFKRYVTQSTIDKLIVRYRAISFKPPLLIYQMGKVGSSTIQTSLENANLPYSIYHIHFLSENGIKYAEEYHRSLSVNTPRHIILSKILRKRILSSPGICWRIITLIREPIHREISDFFENVKSYWPDLIEENGKVDKKRAVEFLQQKLSNFNESTDYACTWFDREIKSTFNLDIYSHPFDSDNGYTIINERNTKVLILKMEDLNRSFDKALVEFLEVSTPIRMLRENIGEAKDYSAEYKYVIEHFSLPESVCRQIYSSKYARHFYNENVLNELIRKWSKKQD